MMFLHGFGCAQGMWRFVEPAFRDEYQTILVDQTGAGDSDLSAWDPEKYSTLHGYAEDVLEICRELDLRDVVFVGHSVSTMTGILAARREPDRIGSLILVGPSPCYVNDGDYVGGFERSDIEDLLNVLDSNYLGWSATLAPVIMGNPDRPELGEELRESFCRTDPAIAGHFARVTFLCDHRDDLEGMPQPSLILQCREDAVAPLCVGDYLNRKLSGSQLYVMNATGHCPHLSAPEETVKAIRGFLAQR